jgi:hypothetical protein
MTPYFTKRIKTPHGHVNFYFNRLYTVEGIRYHVSCIDTKRKTHTFLLHELVGQWVFVNPAKCVLWIKKLEKEFEMAIQESLNS